VANPEVLERALREVDSVSEFKSEDIDKKLPYLECCIMEGLRRYAPATVVGRVVKRDT
jgi:cytochrome P450